MQSSFEKSLVKIEKNIFWLTTLDRNVENLL